MSVLHVIYCCIISVALILPSNLMFRTSQQMQDVFRQTCSCGLDWIFTANIKTFFKRKRETRHSSCRQAAEKCVCEQKGAHWAGGCVQGPGAAESAWRRVQPPDDTGAGGWRQRRSDARHSAWTPLEWSKALSDVPLNYCTGKTWLSCFQPVRNFSMN